MTKNVRKHLSIKEKIQIIAALEGGAKQSDLAKKYSVSTAMICQINKNKEKLIESSTYLPESSKTSRTTSYLELDTELFEWFTLQRQRGVPINGATLQEKANKLAKSYEMTNFACSLGWISRFKKRHGISSGTISGESLSVNLATTESWLKNEWPVLRRQYEDANIFNADETALFYKLLPNKTLKLKGENCSGGKLSKERVTVYLCTSMTGEKRPPLIIGKFKNPRCFKNQLFNDIIYRSNQRAWMTSIIFKEHLLLWDFDLMKMNRKILLLIDNCTAHTIDSTSLTNISLVYLPPNTTSVLQPLDNGIIRSFKVFYKKSLVSRLIESIDAGEIFKINILDAIRMVENSWDAVTITTIMNSFNIIREINEKKTIYNTNGFIDENIRCEIVPFFESEKQFLEYVEIEDHVNTNESEYCDSSDILPENKDELIEIIKEIPKINEEEARKAIRILQQYYEVKDNGSEIYKYILMIGRDLESRYLKQKSRQKKITEYLFKK